MEQLQIFNFNQNEVRTVLINNEPYFVGKDVADILGYKNTRDALSKHVDDEDKGVANCDTLGGTQEMLIINESGLYSLVFGSKLQEAKKFKQWVTHDVLPTLRKTGVYKLPETPEEKIMLLLQATTSTNKKVDDINNDLQSFKQDMPLLNIDCDELQKKVRKVAIDVLGGYKSPAYKDNSIRQKVFEDIQQQIKREFDVNSYKAIKRSQLEVAIKILDEYKIPMALKSQVIFINSEERLKEQA